MTTQLRRYRIREGELDRFVEAWRSGVAPLRARYGFTILGAWSVPERDEFVWIIEHPEFEEADRSYYESSDRTALDPDPAVYIEEAIHAFADSVT